MSYKPVVLSSNERSSVKAFVKHAKIVIADGSTLGDLLGALQGAALLHQSHHWSTRGRTFFADHLLFERLYNESLEVIDQVAERLIGLGGPVIQANVQAGMILAFVQKCGLARTPDEMVATSLRGELAILTLVDRVLTAFEQSDALTHGTSNLLEGVADKHESFVYLLQQRGNPESIPAPPVAIYSYDRS
jgi:starvation-inducible DNA-binding protein